MSDRSKLRGQTKGVSNSSGFGGRLVSPPVKMCSPRNLIQGLGLDGTVGNDLKHGNWIIEYFNALLNTTEEEDGEDAVKEDSFQILNLRNWVVKARDREAWRSRIKKAKARFGL
jgi:hypothetical protein